MGQKHTVKQWHFTIELLSRSVTNYCIVYSKVQWKSDNMDMNLKMKKKKLSKKNLSTIFVDYLFLEGKKQGMFKLPSH